MFDEVQTGNIFCIVKSFRPCSYDEVQATIESGPMYTAHLLCRVHDTGDGPVMTRRHLFVAYRLYIVYRQVF